MFFLCSFSFFKINNAHICVRIKINVIPLHVLEVMFILEEYPHLDMFEKAKIVYSNAFAMIWKPVGNIYK